MKQLTIMVSALLFALSTFAAADKPVLDVVVNGSKTGNSMKMGVMVHEFLKAKGYDSEIVHTDGCVNTANYMAKDTGRPGWFLYSGSTFASDKRKPHGCLMEPTKETFITPFFMRHQTMCTLKSNNFTTMEAFLKDKDLVTVAIGKSRPFDQFAGLEQQFGVDFVEVKYKGSSRTLKGLIAGDTDLIYTGYTKREIQNPETDCFAVSGDVPGKAKFADMFPEWNLANIGHYVFAHSVNIPADRMQEVKELLHESMKTGKLKEFMAISHYTPGYELDANGIGIKEFYDNAYALLGESR